FRSNETRHYQLSLPRPHVQIDVDPAAIGRVHPADAGLAGDARSVVAALLGAIGGCEADPSWATAVMSAAQLARARLRQAIGPYAVLCDGMRDTFDERSPMVRDVTIPASSWGNRLLPVYDPSTNVSARGGGIGQGLGMAIGAAIARPEVPTALMVGDGGLAVHLGELGTVAGEQPWLVMIVFNDGGYGVLRNLQDRHFGRRAGVDLATPDFGALAGAYDIEHRRIESLGDVAEVLDKAVASRAPVLVEVDCDSFGPMPEPFVPPVPMS
ncbi:MAG: thiamine pyrophosphate-binding protein, partial [Nocardioidaceae bacterium]|nr:thiamine pyrophosphate-binding protein [Nocardioidaceae bacterium]